MFFVELLKLIILIYILITLRENKVRYRQNTAENLAEISSANFREKFIFENFHISQKTSNARDVALARRIRKY